MNPFEDSQKTEVLTISLIMLKKYGPDYISWETETLKQQIEMDFGSIGDMSFQKVCAAQLINAHDIAWKEWEVFEKVCASINHEFPVFSMMQPPEPEDLITTIATFVKTSNNEFSEEVLRYMSASCINDGLWYMDGPFEILNEIIQEYYEERGFILDKVGVSESLKKAPYKEINNSSQAQANRVISCRNVLRDFLKELERERKKYAYLLEV